jgi:hypothetical protein
LNLPDKLIVAMLVRDPEKCERLLRKHRVANGRCMECRTISTPEQPCRPRGLARIAARKMEQKP